MNYLFIHQNFPGQYQHVVRHFADRPENRVVFITRSTVNEMVGVSKILYEAQKAQPGGTHPFTTEFDEAVRNGMAVAQACQVLDSQGFRPDIVIGHNGWGEILFVKDVWPDVPLLGYFEFFYHARGSDVDFDPRQPIDWSDAPRLRIKNAVNLLGLEAADWGQTPTHWQHTRYPPHLRGKISVLHEGIDTQRARPDAGAWIALGRDGKRLSRQDEVITYVSRNLEPYRGFHVFMSAAAEIQRRRPNAHIIVIGGDEVSYGAPAPPGTNFREMALAALGSAIDYERIHFLGKIQHETYANVLQISSAHVYLTFPFVLSWSCLEAMSAGCLVIGSATPPVEEVIADGDNGLLVDFFDFQAIADRVDAIFGSPDRMQGLRDRARATILDRFDLEVIALPRHLRLIDDLIAGRRPG